MNFIKFLSAPIVALTRWLFPRVASEAVSETKAVELPPPPERLTDKDFWGAFEAGRRDFSHTILEGVDLSRASLQGILFTGADLRMTRPSAGVDLRAAELTGANLQGISLARADLEGAVLTQANLEGIQLMGANLQGVNFSQANLSRSVLVHTRLQKANLSGAQLCQANLYHVYAQGVNAHEANLAGANLSYGVFEHAVLTKACLREVNLSWSCLRAANVSGADLLLANVSNCDLTESSLVNTRATGIRGFYWAPNGFVIVTADTSEPQAVS
jgi:uncharacterized protein YjbI with pentapeptide repeats